MRALCLALLLAAGAGCAPLEPETAWEDAWGALDQEELRVSLRLRGSLARPLAATVPPSAEEVGALVRRQLEAARPGLETRGFVEATVDDVSIDATKMDGGRLAARWTARLTAKRPAGAVAEDGATLAFELDLPEDPDAPSVLVAVEAEVVEATATTADARACRPTGIAIARGNYSHRTYGFSFLAGLTVGGEGIAECEIRQLATLTNDRTEWDGTATTAEKIREGYERGLWEGIGTGQWVVDTGWDWQGLARDGKHDDSQLHNVPNRRGRTADGLTRTEVQLDRTTRRFLVQVRDRSTGSMRAIRLWRYTWSNDGARLPDQPFAGADVALGRFTGCLGVSGLGEMNAPQDDCR